MDTGLRPLSLVLRCDDGTLGLRTAPDINSQATFHSRLLRVIGIDNLLFHRGK